MWRRLLFGLALLGAFQTAGAQAHGFDFLVGSWRVHHRILRTDGTWLEFDGTCVNWPLMKGQGNVEDHTFNKPSGVTHGVGLRAYDPKTAQWAIWWVDSRDPHLPMDPPVKGHFENGIGTFYSPGTRFIWSHITPTTARWEQAASSDSGKTWVTNWIMEWHRT